MIQSARSENSRSLLREAEEAVLLIEDEAIRELFENKIADMIEKRKDPEAVKTGAKELKRDLLGYLEQQGRINTVNVWMRHFDLAGFSTAKKTIEATLKDIGANGVFEIHLQDREINSPHIQYVGTRAEEVEQALSELVVSMGYEESLQNAASKDLKPFYVEAEQPIITRSTVEELQTMKEIEAMREEKREIRVSVESYLDEFKERAAAIRQRLEKMEKMHEERLQQFEVFDAREFRRTQKERSTEELLGEWKSSRRSRR